MRLRFALVYLLVMFAALLASNAGKSQTVPPLVYFPIIERYETPTFIPTSTGTPTPTLTPTPTDTLSPTLSPTPSPTRGPISCTDDEVMVLDTHSLTGSPGDQTMYVEVCNGTNLYLRNVQVSITLYDNADNPIGSNYYSFRYGFYPGQHYCFEYRLVSQGYAYYRIEVNDYSRNDDSYPELEVSSLTVQPGRIIKGTVTNHSPSTVGLVWFIVNTYDTDQRLTDCLLHVHDDGIGPGASAVMQTSPAKPFSSFRAIASVPQ